MRSKLKMKLSCDQSDWVWSMSKITQDNDVTDCIGLLFSQTTPNLISLDSSVSFSTTTPVR